MDVVHERCCGLDVHKKSVVACVVTPQTRETRSFGTTTRQILDLSDWLREHGPTHVATETRREYWKPVYNLLEPEFTVWVVDASYFKSVPGRPPDIKDAEWIAELFRYGLLGPVFTPRRPRRGLRELVRYRRSLVRERTHHENQIQEALDGANISFGPIAGEVLGVGGRRMLIALADGEDEPRILANLAEGPLRAHRDLLEETLEDFESSSLRFTLGTQLDGLSNMESEIGRLNAEIARYVSPFKIVGH